MTSIFDKVHSVGMSPNASTYMQVSSFIGSNNKEIAIEPPIAVVFEGEEARRVAFHQDGLAARYTDEELRQIGEGSSAAGMQRVIGDIALNESLVDGAIKPLHPGLIDGEIVVQAALPTAPLTITASSSAL